MGNLFCGPLAGLPIAVTLHDAEGERLIDCNEAAWRLYGFASRDEMFEAPARALSAETQPDGTPSEVARRTMTAAAIGAGPCRREWLARRKGGETFLCDLRLSVVEHEGARIVQTLIDDIGDRRAAERALELRAQRDEALGSVSRRFVQGDAGAVQAAIEVVGRALGVHRARVRRFVDGAESGGALPAGGVAVETTHEWQADASVPQVPRADALTHRGALWIRERLARRTHLTACPRGVFVDGMAVDPPLASLIVPLNVGDAVTGWVAFEDLRRTRRWGEADVSFAMRVAEVIALGRARAEAEASLRASEERHRSLVERLPDAVVTVDRASRVRFASAAVTEIFGYTPEEWTSSPGLAAKIAVSQSEDDLAELEAALAGGGGLPSGTTRRAWRRKDGRVVYTDGRIAPIYDALGEFQGVQIILRDATERHRAETAKQRRARLDELVSAVSRSLLGIDPATAIDGALERLARLLDAERVSVFDPDHAAGRLRCSHRWCAVGTEAAWESLDAYPLPPNVFTRLADFGAGADVDPDLATGSKAEQWVATLQRDSGRRILYAPIGYGSRVVGLLSVRLGEGQGATDDDAAAARAVGELLGLGKIRRAAEAALARAKEDAVAASASKSAFLANMSHELRTPLNGVIGMVDLLATTQLDERQRRYVDVARGSADLLLSVINDVLDFSKIEAGKLELESVPFAVSEVVRGVATLLALSAEEKGLALSCETTPDLAAPLLGDPGRLRQVLVNLVSNAIKFTPRGEVAVRAFVESEAAAAATVRVEVRDTGIGVPVEAQGRLFTPFTQVDASTTRAYGGTGLGLAICRELVERMGGRIAVTSAPGCGSTFWFAVSLPRPAPAFEPAAGAPIAEPEAPARGGTSAFEPAAAAAARVLVVEDSAINAEVVAEVLRNAGYSFTLVGDGLAAVDAVKSGGFDLVLMDCQLPGIDGYEAARRIRELEAAAGAGHRGRVPVLALTASATKGDLERSLAAGMDGHITKPVDARRLLSAVAGSLRARGSQPPPPMPEKAEGRGGPPRVVDLGKTLARLQGNRALLDRLVGQFAKGSDEIRARLRSAVAQRDAGAAAFAAHRLRGQVATFDAEALLACIGPFEEAVQRASFTTAAAALHAIEVEFDRVLGALAARGAAPSRLT